AATRAALGVEASACTGARLAGGYLRAARIPRADSAPCVQVWTTAAAAGLVVRLAAGKTCRGAAFDAGWHRGAGSRTGGAALSLWSAGASGAGGRFGVGRRGDRRRANRGGGGAGAPEASRQGRYRVTDRRRRYADLLTPAVSQ